MTEPFTDAVLPAAPDATAPDGSAVRLLVRTRGASMAHFELAPGQVSAAVRHRTVDELWYVLAGAGRMWRSGAQDREIELRPGVALTIPVGTAFQFRNTGSDPLAVVGVTLPPWPGDGEALPAPGRW